MDFLSSFLASFAKAQVLPSGFAEDMLPEHVYTDLPDAPVSSLLCVQAYGAHSVSAPFIYQFHSFPCYLLIYTQKGVGTLKTAESSFSLSEETLMLFDCRQPFSLSISGNFWKFKIYFCTGSLLDAFYQKKSGMFWELGNTPELLHYLHMLDSNNRDFFHRNPFLDIKCFSGLFSDLAIADEVPDHEGIPSYLLYMKKCFDYSYASHYSLKQFEEELDISKYRLCREFTNIFGISPLQYLNRRRIEASKQLLRSSTLTVHEIGSMVGFDNTNHFINLFKRETDNITPNLYRQQK